MIHQSFEEGDEGWIPFGGDAQVELTREPSQVKNGKAALAVRYKFNPGQYGSAVFPVESGQLARLSRIRFWIKTDHSTPIIVILSEKAGGYYSTWFWCNKDQWQQVELRPSDFALDEGPTDPKDPDGRLDLDQVQGIGISDLGQAFQTLAANSAYPLVVDPVSGRHSLYVDDFDLAMSGARASEGAISKSIGDFDRGLLTWVTLGGAELKISLASNPLREPALEATYEQKHGHYVAFGHTLANLNLHGVKKLVFRIATKDEAKFMVYLEKKQPGATFGPRYSYLMAIPGGNRAVEEEIALSEFRPDPSGPADPNGKLTVGDLKSLSLVDITGANSQASRENTLWLSAIKPQ